MLRDLQAYTKIQSLHSRRILEMSVSKTPGTLLIPFRGITFGGVWCFHSKVQDSWPEESRNFQLEIHREIPSTQGGKFPSCHFPGYVSLIPECFQHIPGTSSVLVFEATLPLKLATIALKIGHDWISRLEAVFFPCETLTSNP